MLKTITDPKNNTITYDYNKYHQIETVTKLIDGQTSTTTYLIDSLADPRTVTVTGNNNEKIIYSTNDNANVIQTDVKLNATKTATTTYSWNETNYLKEINEPDNKLTKIEYGNNGKPIKITTPDGKNINLNYDPNNNLISSKDRLNNVDGTNYDSSNRKTDITDTTGNTIMMDYNETNGNLINITDSMSLAENYIYNSGFELSSTPTGWNPSRTPGQGDIYEVTTFNKSSGYKSLHLKSAGSSGLYGVMKYKITVIPQMTYNLSGDIKLGSNSTTEFKVKWYDASDNDISELTGLSLSAAGSWGSDWHHKSTGIEAPLNAVKAEIEIGVIGIGEAWLDSLIFEGGTGRTGNILPSNQSFDYDLDHTGLADDWYPGPIATGISISYNVKKHGVASEKIIGDLNNYKFVGQTLNMSGTKGTMFSLSGWGKQENIPLSGGEWGLKLKFTNIDESIDYHYIPFDRTKNDWQQVSGVVKANKDFNKIEVFVVLNFLPDTVTAWFDDVELNIVNVPSSTISRYNLADNSSFEYDYDNNNWPDGWNASYFGGSGTLTGEWVVLEDTSGTPDGYVYTGTHAIK